jgi:branched-chain amino acid transport system substrate-binding protein
LKSKKNNSNNVVIVESGEPIQIGHLSGWWISFEKLQRPGVATNDGVNMAVQDYGNIHGFSVNVQIFKDNCIYGDRKQIVEQSLNKIISNKQIIGVIGPTCEESAEIAFPIISESEIVMISSSNTSPELTKTLNDTTGYFRTSHNDVYQSRAAAIFAYQSGKRNAVVISYKYDNKSKSLANEFIEAYKEEKNADTENDKKTPSVKEFFTPKRAWLERSLFRRALDTTLNQIQKSLNSPPDVLYFPIDKEGIDLIEKIRNNNFFKDTMLITTESMLSDYDILRYTNQEVYIVKPDFNFYSNINEITKKSGDDLRKAYKKLYKKNPISFFFFHSYDATILLLKAIEASSSKDGNTLVVDRDKVLEEMENVKDFWGITGTINCLDNGDCGSQNMKIIYTAKSGNQEVFFTRTKDMQWIFPNGEELIDNE